MSQRGMGRPFHPVPPLSFSLLSFSPLSSHSLLLEVGTLGIWSVTLEIFFKKYIYAM